MKTRTVMRILPLQERSVKRSVVSWLSYLDESNRLGPLDDVD